MQRRMGPGAGVGLPNLLNSETNSGTNVAVSCSSTERRVTIRANAGADINKLAGWYINFSERPNPQVILRPAQLFEVSSTSSLSCT